MYKKILVPLDGSRIAEKVLPFVCTIAGGINAEIVLVRIIEYPSELFVGCGQYSFLDPEIVKKADDRKKAIRDDLTRYLERIASKLQQDGLRVTTEVCEGPVVEAILASIDRLCIDMIAMSTLGDGGGNSWMIGSIANRVLREAKVQVFLVRPDQDNINSGFFQKHRNSFTRNSNDFSRYRFRRMN